MPSGVDTMVTPQLPDKALMSPEQSAREARALAEIVQRINQSLSLIHI